MNCADCRHSQALIYDAGPTLECHRNPPQSFALNDEVFCGWPSVEEADRCGEWQPTPEPTDLASRFSIETDEEPGDD